MSKGGVFGGVLGGVWASCRSVGCHCWGGVGGHCCHVSPPPLLARQSYSRVNSCRELDGGVEAAEAATTLLYLEDVARAVRGVVSGACGDERRGGTIVELALLGGIVLRGVTERGVEPVGSARDMRGILRDDSCGDNVRAEPLLGRGVTHLPGLPGDSHRGKEECNDEYNDEVPERWTSSTGAAPAGSPSLFGLGGGCANRMVTGIAPVKTQFESKNTPLDSACISQT